ncbi:MAG: iron complex outermembrane receptor protein [Paraglaciecola sp.]|jgi:iron complex outermembrane receptor protein
MRDILKTYFYLLIIGFVAGGFASPAKAQIQTTSELKDEPVDIIEVIAQKHPQDIRDVALSISIIDGEEIVERQLKDSTALSSLVPNFKITQNAAEGTPPAVNIRGVGSVDYNTSTTSPIGIYLDGAAGGSANSQLVNLYDVDSIEILRGPQGTLFGRNTTGGAILINSIKPQNNDSGYFNVGYAQRNHLSAQGAVNHAFSTDTAARLAFTHQDYEYSSNNLYAPAPQAEMRQTHARVSLSSSWDKLELFAKAYAGKWDGVVNPAGSIGVVKSFNPTTGLPESFCSPAEAGSSQCTDAFGFQDGSDDFYDVAVNNDVNNNSPHQSDSWGLNVHAQYQLSANSYLYSISSINSLDREHFYNSDGSPARLGEGNQNVFTDTISQELRIHSEFEKLYLIAGLYWLDESLKQDNSFDLLRDFRSVESLFSNAATFFYDNDIDTQAKAIFAHGEFKLSPATQLTAGLRYTDENTEYHALGLINIALSNNDQSGLTVPGWDVVGEVGDSNVSGKIALNHKFNSQLSSFISYSRGFKSGGYNGALISSEIEAQRNDYGAETLNAYEIGMRARINNRLNLYSAVFYYDYKDQQVFMNQSAIEPGAPPLQLLSNVGKSEIFGAELELQAQINASFSSKFSLGYLPEANLESFVDQAGNLISDNRLPFTSKWNIAGQFEYIIELQSSRLLLQLDFDYQSEFYFDQNQSDYARQDGYTLLNARVAVEKNDWVFSAWVKNLGDEEYSHLKFDLINLYGMLQDFKGEARQIGVDLRYEF